MNSSSNKPLLEVRNLQTHFSTSDGVTKAVDDVSFDLHRGRTLALVGESGSGKSVTSNSILRLIQSPGHIVGGQINLHSQRLRPIDLAQIPEGSDELYHVRGGIISMVFQEPMTALSPVHSIGNQITEAILVHQQVSNEEARQQSIEMLDRVGIPEPAKRYKQYPHELSGGMRQRAVIAMALVCQPELLIADEPTTALDVTIQAQILGLIRSQQQELGFSVLLVTHDFGVVAQMADEVAVMKSGRILEQGPVRDILSRPQHDYTKMLLDALPSHHRPAATVISSPSPEPETPRPLLSVRNLCKSFPGATRGFWRRTTENIPAVQDLSFNLAPGEALGLVGESGSGKTTAARCILRALNPTSGEIHFRLPDESTSQLDQLSDQALKPLRPHMQMIFQDPYSSLNPRMSVREIIAEPLRIHRIAKESEIDDRVVDMLRRVGLEADHRQRYPHAFSGGQRQRIGIARALIMRPSLVVCDEATSALDVSVQAQVIELLQQLRAELNLSFLFVAHNLDVVRNFCDRVAVMRRGRLMELESTERLFDQPQHPYTQLLLSVIPTIDPDQPIDFAVAEKLALLD